MLYGNLINNSAQDQNKKKEPQWLNIKDIFTQEQSFIEKDRLILFDYKEIFKRNRPGVEMRLLDNLDFTNG